MDRGAWWAIIHRVTKSWTRLKWFCRHAPMVCVHLLYLVDTANKNAYKKGRRLGEWLKWMNKVNFIVNEGN